MAPRLPGGFEKNWLIHYWQGKAYLFYSVQPWRVFESDAQMRHWRLICELALIFRLRVTVHYVTVPIPSPWLIAMVCGGSAWFYIDAVVIVMTMISI